MNSLPLVYLVDDEPGMLRALTRLLETEGFTVRAFASAREFLAGRQPVEVACLVLDVALPDCDGPSLQRQLIAEGNPLPIIFLTGHGDIPLAVRSIQAGAVDFLTKPVPALVLLSAVRRALAQAETQAAERAASSAFRSRLALLTAREREVLGHVVAGKLSKQIAAELGTGLQTIKIHRMRLMEKMGVTSVAELVRAADQLGLPRVE
jgi:FixJ family two-component response regulator